MNIADSWEKALKHTEILRPRVTPLETFGPTALSYVLLSESSVNHGDTVTRRGGLTIEKPAILLPGNAPQFSGFDVEGSEPDWGLVTGFLLVRGVSFPSLKYSHKSVAIDVFEGDVKSARRHFLDKLRREEDVLTGLVMGPDDVWAFSLLIYIAGQVATSAQGDVRKILDDTRRRGRMS